MDRELSDRANLLVEEARAQHAHGDHDHAAMTADEAISTARRAFGPDDPRYAEALEIGAEIAADAGMPNAADARFRAAIDLLQEKGVRGEPLAHALYQQALFRRAVGDIGGAVRALGAVVSCAGEAGSEDAASFAALALTVLGDISFDAGRHEQARSFGERALDIWLRQGDPRRLEVADALAVVGRSALRLGDVASACEHLETACAIYAASNVDVRLRHAAAAHDYARSLDAAGRLTDARAAYLRALDLYREGDQHRVEIEERLLDLARH